MTNKPQYLTPFRLRLLAYLDQRGPTHRGLIAQDLSPPDSSIARGCYSQGNGARLVGAWTKTLIDAGLVEVVQDREGYYRHHALTLKGSLELRRWMTDA